MDSKEECEIRLCPEPCEKHGTSPCGKCFFIKDEDAESLELDELTTQDTARTPTPLERAQAIGIVSCVISVAVAPLVWMVLQYLAASHHVDLVLDERILLACLAGWATILAVGFKKTDSKR